MWLYLLEYLDYIRERERERRGRGGETETETQREMEVGEGGEGGRENSNSNSKTLIHKDSSVRSIWTYLTVSPCYSTNRNKHDYTTKRY